MKKTNIKRIRKSILQLNVFVFFSTQMKVLCFFFVTVIVSGSSIGLQA